MLLKASTGLSQLPQLWLPQMCIDTLTVCCRMLLESAPELNQLPQLWLQTLLAHVQRPGQSRDDIVRRSSGIPFAFVALFAAEPTGHPKTLLATGDPAVLSTQSREQSQQL